MAPIPGHEKSGKKKCHQISQLFISIFKCSAIDVRGDL